MSTYILQKRISSPNFTIEAGAEFKQYASGEDSAFMCNNYNLSRHHVVNNPEWFKLKEEIKYTKNDHLPYEIIHAITVLLRNGYSVKKGF